MGCCLPCRYEAMVVGDSRKRDLSRAEAYYFQAIDVFPEGMTLRGQPWQKNSAAPFCRLPCGRPVLSSCP